MNTKHKSNAGLGRNEHISDSGERKPNSICTKCVRIQNSFPEWDSSGFAVSVSCWIFPL